MSEENPFKNVPHVMLLTIAEALERDAKAWAQLAGMYGDSESGKNCKDNHDYYMEHAAMARALFN